MKTKARVVEPGIVEVDVSNTKATTAAEIDQIFDDVLRVVRTQPRKPYIMTCWENAQMQGEAAKRYETRVRELYAASEGVVRYAVTDFASRVAVQVDAITAAASRRSHIYPDRQSALEAIRAKMR